MFKSILVALDGLDASNSALNVVVEIAKSMKAKVKGIYVEDIARLMLPDVNISQGHIQELQEIVEKNFIEEKDKIRKTFVEICEKNNLSYDFICVRDRISTSLLRYGKSSDVIVVGRRGKSFVENSPEPGPVVEELLKHTVRPVMVVPPEVKLNSNVLIAYDDSETSLRALSIGAQYAKSQSAKVNLISVSDNEKIIDLRHCEAKDFLSAYELDVKYTKGTNQSKPWINIIEEIRSFNAGLVVLGAYGHNRLKELILGSTTKHILMNAHCPVLLCR